MKGKSMGGKTSRAEVEKEAHSTTDGFNKGGATKGKRHMGVHGKGGHHRHDKRDRKGKFAKGGAVFSEAGPSTKTRAGFGQMKIDKEDE